ncbi:MAG: LysR family transcriptional regulator [Oscillospiraceae bacterium]|jgi:DNA-binding transcriptional LysR family regulator
MLICNKSGDNGMLTYEELQYFAAFAKYGTLTEVAEKYNISQPTITRAMKHAEEVFGIPLFNRTKNSISLNENGVLAAQEISLLLKQTDEMIERVRAHDKASRTVSIGTSAAVELPGLIDRISRAFPDKAISLEPGMPQDLENGLRDGTYQLVILPYDPTSPERSENQKKNDGPLYAKAIGEEHLMFYLPAGHPMAGKKTLTLSDLDGENFLLFSNIGFWADIVKSRMKNSRFLVQSERYTFEELIENSVLPCFTTDITIDRIRNDGKRVAVPISDPEVNVTYYLTCRKSKYRELRAVFQ